jgi:hypothetical protein
MFKGQGSAKLQCTVTILIGCTAALSGCQPSASTAPAARAVEIRDRVCRYKEDDLSLGDRLFLRTAEFNQLGLPIGTSVKVTVIVAGTPHKVSNLILDHDEQMADCAVRLNEATRRAVGVDDDVRIEPVDARPLCEFRVITGPQTWCAPATLNPKQE